MSEVFRLMRSPVGFLSRNLKDWTKQYKDENGNWIAPYKKITKTDFKRLIERWNSIVYEIIHPITQTSLKVAI